MKMNTINTSWFYGITLDLAIIGIGVGAISFLILLFVYKKWKNLEEKVENTNFDIDLRENVDKRVCQICKHYTYTYLHNGHPLRSNGTPYCIRCLTTEKKQFIKEGHKMTEKAFYIYLKRKYGTGNKTNN